jgi:hypothetical protein
MPVTVHIALPIRGGATPSLGRISPGHPDFVASRHHVDRVVADGFGRMLSEESSAPRR